MKKLTNAYNLLELNFCRKDLGPGSHPGRMGAGPRLRFPSWAASLLPLTPHRNDRNRRCADPATLETSSTASTPSNFLLAFPH